MDLTKEHVLKIELPIYQTSKRFYINSLLRQTAKKEKNNGNHRWRIILTSECGSFLLKMRETLAVGLEFNLQEEGYLVDWAKDGKQALEKFNSQEYD